MFYNLKKNIYTAFEKYEIVRQGQRIRRILYLIIITWIVSSLLTIINEYLLSPIKDRQLKDYLNFFLLNIKVILTSDFSDFEHLTFITLIISILMVVVGIVVVGMLTGQIISALMLVSEKNKYIPAKHPKFKFRLPVVICGLNDRIFDILKELRSNPLSQYREIVIIDEKADKLEISSDDKRILTDIYFIKGSPTNRDVLKKAINIEHKTDLNYKPVSAIILSNPKYGDSSDQKAIETSLAIESFDESVYTIVDFQQPKNMQFLENTKVDETLSIHEYDYKLLAQASLNLGMTKVYDKLLEADNKNSSGSMFISAIPEIYEGKSYKDIKKMLSENMILTNIIFIGFKKDVRGIEINDDIEQYLKSKKRNDIIVINPRKITQYMFNELGINRVNKTVFITHDTVLNNNDKLIYISNNQIEFN